MESEGGAQSTTKVLERTDAPRPPEGRAGTTTLPEAARGGEIYLPQFGVTRKYASFETQLAIRLDGIAESDQKTADAKDYFSRVSEDLFPTTKDIIAEMKRLGIQHDVLGTADFGGLLHAIKADQLNERQAKDYPKVNNDKYTPDPRSPLYGISVTDGRVMVVPEISPLDPQPLLNSYLQTEGLTKLLQNYYDTSTELKTDALVTSDPQLAQWVEQQAMSRNTLLAKGELKPAPLTLEGATKVKNLSDEAKQASNTVELWRNPDGRNIVLKHGPIHTLQAEILENRLMKQMGVPVPETYLEVHDGEPVLVVGFLDAHVEEDDPFRLSEEYETSRTLQRGMTADLLIGQYNRRPHNLMMKDGKVAFIDHGAATFSRASGGFKEFSGNVDTAYMWDILRTIPDNDLNGDVPVNEAYANVLTVEGGPHGKLVIKDLPFLKTQVDRLDKLSNDQIAGLVEESGYEDGPDSIAQMTAWIDSEGVSGRIQELSAKFTTNPEEFTQRDAQYLRWAEGAKATFESAIAAGGMKTYMTEALVAKRDNLVKYLRGEMIKELQRTKPETETKKTQERPEKRPIREAVAHPEMFQWDAVLPQLLEAQAAGKTIVVTNGHFVMMHAGHSSSLEMTREVGANDREDHDDNGVALLAIVNADHQTEQKDPIKAAAQDAHGRAMNVYDNRFSDYVAISEAPEGDNSLITDFRKLAEAGIITENFIYVKGGDYSADASAADAPPEAKIVLEAGGKFIIVSRVGEYSTSSEVDRMLEAARTAGRI